MGGGGGVHVNLTKKALTALVVFFCLVLGLVDRSPMVNFKEKYHFSRFRRGSNSFRGGGWGSNCLFPIETQMTCIFPGGSGPPAPAPLDPHLTAIYLVSPDRKMMRSPLALVLVFLQLRCLFSVEPRNKIVS